MRRTARQTDYTHTTMLTPNQQRLRERNIAVAFAVAAVLVVVITLAAVLAPEDFHDSSGSFTRFNSSSSSTGRNPNLQCNITSWQNNTYNPNTDTTSLLALSATQCNQTAIITPGAACLWWIQAYTDDNPPCTTGDPCCWIGTDVNQCGIVLQNVFFSASVTANVTC
jgi:hypothetical protein